MKLATQLIADKSNAQLVKDMQSEGFQRAFFVCEEKTQYSRSNNTLMSSLTLHLVLVGGTNATQNKIKEKTKELRELTAEINV